MIQDLELRVRFTVVDVRLSSLYARAFGYSCKPRKPWAARLQRHRLTWIGAFIDSDLVGFVHACWDGGAHAFISNGACDRQSTSHNSAPFLRCRAPPLDREPDRGYYEVFMKPDDDAGNDNANGLPANMAAQGPKPRGAIALVGGSVIDATGARSDMTILIRHGRIAALGPSNKLEPPPDTRIVDLAGKYVLPGLWDMHVHVFQDESLPLFLANGVTGIRRMGAAPIHHHWRDRLVAGDLLAPRMVLASRIIDGPCPLRPNSIAVTTEGDAREAVRQSKTDCADFLKVYSLIPRAAYFALAEEAYRLGIPFGGHVPLGVTVTEVSAAGQRSVKHLEGVLPATSARVDEIHRDLTALEVRNFADMGNQQMFVQRAAETHDPALAEDVYAGFVERGTWHVPTLAVLQAAAYVGTAEFPLTDYLPVIEPDLCEPWEMAGHARPTAEERAAAKRLFELQLQIVGDMHRAGVELMAGTDTFVAGGSMHDELELLVRAGLTEMQALRTATSQPARYLGLDDDFGAIAENKIADFLVLNADPLENIKNTRDIHAVLLSGSLLTAEDIREIRVTAEVHFKHVGQPN